MIVSFLVSGYIIGALMALFGRSHPMVTYALSLVLMLAGVLALLALEGGVMGLILAAALFGAGWGIKTIARGTMPLALFGRKDYGARLGWIAFANMAANASAPFAFAALNQAHGGWVSLGVMALLLGLALIAFRFIPDPRRVGHDAPQNRSVPAQ